LDAFGVSSLTSLIYFLFFLGNAHFNFSICCICDLFR
jgi:hypothetical protein